MVSFVFLCVLVLSIYLCLNWSFSHVSGYNIRIVLTVMSWQLQVNYFYFPYAIKSKWVLNCHLYLFLFYRTTGFPSDAMTWSFGLHRPTVGRKLDHSSTKFYVVWHLIASSITAVREKCIVWKGSDCSWAGSYFSSLGSFCVPFTSWPLVPDSTSLCWCLRSEVTLEKDQQKVGMKL